MADACEGAHLNSNEDLPDPATDVASEASASDNAPAADTSASDDAADADTSAPDASASDDAADADTSAPDVSVSDDAADADTSAPDASVSDGASAPEAAARHTRRMLSRRTLCAGTLVVVVVVVVAGLFVWHNTPGFCSTVCHTSMNKYVQTYESDNVGMMSVVHRTAGDTCLDCHNPEITEQIGEVATELGGTYEMDAEQYVVVDNSDMASKKFCLKSGCHDSWNAVVETTEGLLTDSDGDTYNPHSSHQDGSIVCGDCHHSHKISTLYCAKCHSFTNMPEGWEATSE